ncbi:peptidoglycan DD-metalloendopeptidase family protein [Glaciimonas soli]|uniref:Peptidoglycan DD-metalloendopeptidase family protein n=1 Tax=Glaciimonas soli TaxID=2590999 RepID=A0A843YQD3_9BURK|nr:peptidoglycan DD-metalloendopeptidase family protein [Glaciimonas soli]MQQ99732.1 peptidoglycan DD-metalloendopeptidase family protein [Glaciimonas soli]
MKIIRFAVVSLIVSVLAACGTPKNAPISSAGTSTGTSSGAGTGASTPATPVVPSGPGYYTVQKGDTLYSIGRTYRQNPRDIASWSNLSNMNGIEVGQVLRVLPPGGNTGSGSSARAANAASSKQTPAKSKTPATTATPDAPFVAGEEKSIDWMWPTDGKRVSESGQSKKGVDILGTAGQTIVAAAAGKVMYAGSGIRGYGNLVIIKHTTNLLSVYAHNKSIVVKEGQMVTKGQKIAEMGQTDSNTVKLYFEIRRQGKPINPALVLSGR